MRELNVFTIHEAPMESYLPENIRKHVISLGGISLTAGVLLSILAPYHTGLLSFGSRLAYWTVLCFFGGLGAGIFLPLTKRMNWNFGLFGQIIGQSVSSSILVFAMLFGSNAYKANKIELAGALPLFFFVWVIAITITTIAHLTDRATDPSLVHQERRAEIYERLKPKLRNSKIYALMAEDHYVRVITSAGEDLILMRLSDAIKETGDLKGLSVHRSG